MNVVREISRINQTELDIAINTPSASWHEQYKDSAYIFVGGLPYDLTEGDVISIFSQYGEVVDVNLPRANPNSTDNNNDRKGRDGEAVNGASSSQQPKPVGKGKHRGFGFLMYEDQRSTVLAVDNLNGAQVLGRTLRVDHVASYKQPKVTDDEGNRIEADTKSFNAAPLELGLDHPGAAVSMAADEEEPGDLEDSMASYFQRLRREDKGSSKHGDPGSDEREDKRRRKEERARIRAEREGRRVHASGSACSSRRRAESPDRHRRSDRDRGCDREDVRDHKRRQSSRDRRDDSEEEGVNRYEQAKRRSVLDAVGSHRDAAERHSSSRRRSRTPPASSSRLKDYDAKGDQDRSEDRHRDRPSSSSHHPSSRSHNDRRRSRSPRN